MREIKFRAMMVKPHLGHEGDWAFLNGVGHDHWTSKNGTYRGQLKDGTLGEYTGLKDKNGVEIYEGDKVSGYYQNPNKEFVVKFRASQYNCGFVACEYGSDNQYIQLWYDGIEIIGTVHDKE